MSSNHLNLYVIQNAKGLNSYEALCTTMFGAKKNKLNQKLQLTHLREMSIYLSAVTSMDETTFSAITLFIKDLGDSDMDRKIFRTAMFLLMEAISEYSARFELTNKRGAILVLNSMLGKELALKNSSSKQLLIWRSLGTIVYAHNSQALQQQMASDAVGVQNYVPRNTEIETFVVSKLLSTFEALSFPVKQKKSVLFGDDKEYLPKMLQWTSVLSAIVRCEEALPKKAWENLSFGLTCMGYIPLAQHAFRALWNTAKLTKDPAVQLDFINQLLADRDGTKGREYLNTADVLCCTYYIRTLTALSSNCADLVAVDPSSSHPASTPLLKALVGLYVVALRFLQSNSVKIVTEMAQALLHKELGAQLICLINQHLRTQRRGNNSPRSGTSRATTKANVIAMVTEALQNHLAAQLTIESMDLPPLLRTCETLGQFLVHRPYFSAKQQQRDGDTIASLWTTLRRHYRNCLMPKDDCVGTDAQRAGRALTQRQQRAQAGSSGGGSSCVGYAAKSAWSWSSENASIATSAVRHSPHILCALLRAQIWMAPDKRYCPKEHSLLWSSFAESLISSWQLLSTTLNDDFDVLSLLLPLLTEYFARVQASILVPLATVNGRSAAATPSASYANFLELGEVGAGPAAVPEVGIYYHEVYVDVLLVLAEQLVTVTKSGIAVTFLQSVWKWLQAFTSVKQHKQQAATQLKRDLRNKVLAPANGGTNSLLFPSNLASIAPLATAEAPNSNQDMPVSHEPHADRALLESIARMTILAQRHAHLHSAFVPEGAGSSCTEAVRVMQNLHSSGMWHLVDNAMVCFALPLAPSAGAEATGTDFGQTSTLFMSHSSALLLITQILSDAAIQGEMPNVRNSAILGLVKLSSQLLLLSEKGDVSFETGGEVVLLRAVFYNLACVYLTHFGHTLDVTYRHILQQLILSASTEPRTRGSPAAGPMQENADLVVELMSHIFAHPSETPLSATALPSMFSILQSAMKMLCVELQTASGALEGGFRDFATAHAMLSRNTFVLLVPPVPPIEAEEDEDDYPQEFEDLTTPAVVSSATSGGAQFDGFDDDLLGGWSSATAVLQPTIAARPVMTAAPNVNLLDTEDMWIFDTPLVPEKSAKLSMTASLKAGALLDFFGQSSQPLVPSTTSTKQQPPTGDVFAATIQPEPMPPKPPIILFRNIYDEDEPFVASADPVPVVSEQPTSDISPTHVSAPESAASHISSGALNLDWPAGDNTHNGDGFDFSASAAPTFDGWGSVETGHSLPSHNVADDGFAPTLATHANVPAEMSRDWPDLGSAFASSSPIAPALNAVAGTDDGFGDMSGFQVSPSNTAKVTRRASFGSTGTAALSAEEVSALAAAKRANRRSSMGASSTHSKQTTDPFFSTGPLVPSPNPTVTQSKQTDTWPNVSTSDGFPPASIASGAWAGSTSDGFESSDVFASTTNTATASADDGFSATPADFVATTAAPTAVGPGYYGHYEGYPPAYPPAYDPAAYAAYPPAAPYSYNYPTTDPNHQPQGYAASSYGHAAYAAPYPYSAPQRYEAHPSSAAYADPNYNAYGGYPAPSTAAGYYTPAPEYAQPPTGYPAAYPSSAGQAGQPPHPYYGTSPPPKH